MPDPSDLPFGFQDFLDTLEGVAYAVERDGTVLAVSRDSWSSFARENGGEAIADPHAIVGRNLLDFVSGDEVRESYRDYMEALSHAPTTERVAFGFRCDAPDRKRQMRMAISPMVLYGTLRGFLFHSVVWEEVERPAMALYDFAGLLGQLARAGALPHLAMCSYCQRVRFPAGSDPEAGEWMDAAGYYRRGGDEQVAISHGVCTGCAAEVRNRIHRIRDNGGETGDEIEFT